MGLRDKVSEAKDAAANSASDAKETVSEKTDGAKETVSEARGSVSIMSSDTKEAVSGKASKIRVRTTIQQYGGKAVNVTREADLGQTYRFGKTGLKYGKKYGDYVPIAGGFLPYIGFVSGVGVGVLDGTDIVSADKVDDFSSSLSDAIEQVVQNGSQETYEDLVTGGVVFTDSYFGEAGEDSLEDILEMDFDEFAGKQ
jgi:hypothetical protein